MGILNRIYRLEDLAKNRQRKQVVSRPLPTKWEDFVGLTTIRSGGKMVQFKPYDYQILLSNLMDKFSNIVVVKSRQLGITQTAISKFLHRACLSPAYSSMSFLRSQDDASAIARRVRMMLDGLQEYIKPANDNVGYLKLLGAGELYFKNSSREGSRSYDSVLDFLFDEAAFAENIASIYAASSPSGALAGDDITKLIVSTPSAKSGWYWDKLTENNGDIDVEETCQAVAAGELYQDIPGVYWWVDLAGTLKLIIHWRSHPVYAQNPDYLKYRQQQDGTDWETVLREYDLRFVDSSVSVFSSDLVRASVGGSNDELRDSKANYYIGVDTATTGDDYCCAVVLKEVNDNYSVVALYRKRQQTSEFNIFQIGELIERYKPETVGIEVTGGVGTIFLEQLSKQFKEYKFEAIRTTGDTKPTMISGLVLALEKQVLKIPQGSPIIDELLSFRRQGQKLGASSGKHDDTIMALSFALTVSQFRKEEAWF